MQAVPYDNYQTAILDLQNGRIDAVFGDTAVTTEWLKTKGNENLAAVGEKVTDANYFSVGLGIVVRKGNKALLDKLNKALAEVKQDGRYDVIYQNRLQKKSIIVMNNLFFLINAAGLTITLAGAALILGLLLAVLFTTWESICWRPVALLGSCWMTLIRGLPELLVVLLVYYGTLQFIMLLGDGIHINFIFLQTTWQVDPDCFFPQNSEFDFIPFFVVFLPLFYSTPPTHPKP